MSKEEAILTTLMLRMIAFKDESDTQAAEAYMRARHNCFILTGIDVAGVFAEADKAGIALEWSPVL